MVFYINEFYNQITAVLFIYALGSFMKNDHSSNDFESTTLGWKFVAIVAGITAIFFTFLYLAMSVEPDYMPNREPKMNTQPAETSVTNHTNP